MALPARRPIFLAVIGCFIARLTARSAASFLMPFFTSVSTASFLTCSSPSLAICFLPTFFRRDSATSSPILFLKARLRAALPTACPTTPLPSDITTVGTTLPSPDDAHAMKSPTLPISLTEATLAALFCASSILRRYPLTPNFSTFSISRASPTSASAPYNIACVSSMPRTIPLPNSFGASTIDSKKPSSLIPGDFGFGVLGSTAGSACNGFCCPNKTSRSEGTSGSVFSNRTSFRDGTSSIPRRSFF